MGTGKTVPMAGPPRTAVNTADDMLDSVATGMAATTPRPVTGVFMASAQHHGGTAEALRSAWAG